MSLPAETPFFDFFLALRRLGLPIGVREQRAIHNLLLRWDLTDRDRLRDAIACLLGRGQQETQLVRDLFDAFFPRVDAFETAEHRVLPSRTGGGLSWPRVVATTIVCLILALVVSLGVRREPDSPTKELADSGAAFAVGRMDDADRDAGQAAVVHPESPAEFDVPPLPPLPWHLRFSSANRCAGVLFCAAAVALFLIRRRYELASQLRTQILQRLAALPGPSEFRLQNVNVEPLLLREELEEIAALLCRLCSRVSQGTELDLSATVRAASVRGALVEVKYVSRRQSEQIIVLLDSSYEMRPFLPRIRAWLHGLAKRGVELQVHCFNEAMELVDGNRTLNLADLVGRSLTQPMLLFTTGLALSRVGSDLPEWVTALYARPRYAVVNPIRQRALWRSNLQKRAEIVPLSRSGLTAAAYLLARDQGVQPTRPDTPDESSEIIVTGSQVRRVLQLAALLPTTPVELVEWLRQRFAPECPDEAVWLARDYSSDPSGSVFVFPGSMQQTLHRELADLAPQLADLARCGLLEKLLASEPPAGTAAHLRWRLSCALLRVSLRDPENRIAGGAERAVQDLCELQKSSIREEVVCQLEALDLKGLGTHAAADLALARSEALAPEASAGGTAGTTVHYAKPPSLLIHPEVGDFFAPTLLAVVTWTCVVLAQSFPRQQHEALYLAAYRPVDSNTGILEANPLKPGAPQLVQLYVDSSETGQSVRLPRQFKLSLSMHTQHVHIRVALGDGRVGYSNQVVIPPRAPVPSPMDLGNEQDLSDAPDLARPKKPVNVIRQPRLAGSPAPLRATSGRPQNQPEPQIQPQPAPEEFDAANETLMRAQSEYVSGFFTQAISTARTVQRINPTRAWRIIGAAACNLKDLSLISEAFKNLDSASRQYLLYTCQRQGIRNTGGDKFEIRKQTPEEE